MAVDLSADQWRSIATLWAELGEMSSNDVQQSCQHLSTRLRSLVGASGVLMVVHRRMRPASAALNGIDPVFSWEEHRDADFRRQTTIDWAETLPVENDPVMSRIADAAGRCRIIRHRAVLAGENRPLETPSRHLFDRIDLEDRMNGIVSLGGEVEVSFCLDRALGEASFDQDDHRLLAAVLPGLRPLAAKFALSQGLMAGQRQLTDDQARLVTDLVGPAAEAEIADKHGLPVARLHRLEDRIYQKLAVPNRIGLMNLWLGGKNLPTRLSDAARAQDARRVAAGPRREASIVGRVRRALDDAMDSDSFDVESVARRLGVSVRSLQRDLKAADTSYRTLADQARRRRAARLLESSNLSLTQVALKLGYGQSSSLNRAVRRWTGLTPTKWRRALREER